jgi:CelD/BcsL family acetyltransferase involved in cellulose biosynthesis
MGRAVGDGPTALRDAATRLCVRGRRGDGAWCIATVRQAARLVAVWPLQVRYEGGVRVARHFGCGSNEEYAGPVIAGDVERAAIVAALVGALRDHGDLLWAYNVLPEDAAAIAGLARSRDRIDSPLIACGAADSHAAWMATRSRNFRNALASARRQLARQGSVAAGLVAASDSGAFCDWMFTAKRDWGASRGISTWFGDPHAAAVWRGALADPVATGAFGIALRLDGRPIAGVLCLDGAPIELCMTVFDPAFARWSPGSLVYEDLVAHAIASGRDIDLRITWDDYKRRWTTASDRRDTLCVALTPRGLPSVWQQKLRLQLRPWRRWAGEQRRRWRR